MLCEKCHVNEGTLYTFYYGNYDQTVTRVGNEVTTRTHAEGSDTQQAQVPLCQKCILDFEYQELEMHWGKIVAVAVLLPLAVYGFISYFQQQNNVLVGLLLIGVVAFILLYLTIEPLETITYRRSDVPHRITYCMRNEVGSRLAIRLRFSYVDNHVSDLAKQGYNHGWTPKEYTKFSKTAKPIIKYPIHY